MSSDKKPMIKLLKKPSREQLKDLRQLLLQLTDRPLNIKAFKQEGACIYILIDTADKRAPIVGMASIYFINKMTGVQAFIEDVVLDNNYRGQGLGKKITEHLITVARRRKIKCIDLTSKPDRVAANKLYQSLGFELMAAATEKGTNLYRLNL